MNKNNKISLYLMLLGLLSLIAPNIFLHTIDGWLIFILNPYLLLPIIMMFGISAWFSSNIGFKTFNIILSFSLSILVGILIFEGGGLNLTL